MGQSNSFLKLDDIKGEFQTTNLRSENRFVIEPFAPGSAVESFGTSIPMDFEPDQMIGALSRGDMLVPSVSVGGLFGPGGKSF
ncbi:hypothetical protein PMIT1320_01632 [Prochlorococcus marinus str. MIT 1320]|nr:hypothetical protein PMIT1320_01632 [Prochlorococcus marinus str. MIT 1320]